MRKLAFSVAALLLLACTTHRDHLVRGQRLYQQTKYEEALSIWRVLELNMDSLEDGEQARYAYLRGMTDYRLGFRQDARHWLAIAKAIEKEKPGGLTGDWPQKADAALADLNRDVFGDRMAQGGAEDAPSAPGAATEGFDPVRCGSDADCRLEESCLEGTCQAPAK
jgi:hypothetical protein